MVGKEFFKVDMDAWKADMDTFKADLHDSRSTCPFDFAQGPKPVPARTRPESDGTRGDDNEDRNYQNGTRALDAGRWDEAVEYFTRVVNQNGTRADGAMYWIAWALNKQGNGAAALSGSRDCTRRMRKAAGSPKRARSAWKFASAPASR